MQRNNRIGEPLEDIYYICDFVRLCMYFFSNVDNHIDKNACCVIRYSAKNQSFSKIRRYVLKVQYISKETEPSNEALQLQ